MTQPQSSMSKKICLLGASAVGKTSLVKRFVEGKFDETYRTTIGVHIVSKEVTCDDDQVKLIIWDLEGKDDPRLEYSAMYLGGAQGYILVADVTRPDTLDVAKGLLSNIERHRKKVREKKESILAEELEEDDPPFVLLLNKVDILQSPELTNCAVEIFGDGATLFPTSAKTGDKVNEAFACLVRRMLFGHSLNERALFDSLFIALDSLVLERSTGGHAFRPIHNTVPEWAHNLITQDPDQPSQGLWIVRSHFLKDYVLRAIPWWDQHEGGTSVSEPWEEAGPSETGLDLEVAATAIGSRKLLVIKRLAPSLRDYKQRMQDNRLKLHQRSSEL